MVLRNYRRIWLHVVLCNGSIDVVLFDGERGGLGGRDGLGLSEEFGFPGGERLDGFALFRLLVTLDEALRRGIRNDAGKQSNRANRVIITRDGVLHLVRVAVGVENGDDGDAKLVRLVNGEVLLLGVDDPHGRWGLCEITDTAEALLQLDQLALLNQQLLLGVAAGGVVEVNLLELLHAREALGDRLEVGE